MEFVANIIFSLHVLFVLFVLIAPLTEDVAILMLHAITIPFIMMHWVTNDNTCCLTVTEAFFRQDVEKKDLFFHRLIGPVYEPRHDQFIIIGMLGLLGISLTKLYHRWNKVLLIYDLAKEDLFGSKNEKEKVE